MAIWDWTGSSSSKKTLNIFLTRPDPTTGAYGPIVLYDSTPPLHTASITAQHMSFADKEAERAKVETAGLSYAYTMSDGSTIRGIPFSFSDKQIKGAEYSNGGLYEVTVEIQRTDL